MEIMGVRKSINRYKTTPHGYDYKEVLKKGKAFYTYEGFHSEFEMVPFPSSNGGILWSAEHPHISTFKVPEGTIKIRWNNSKKRWEEEF